MEKLKKEDQNEKENEEKDRPESVPEDRINDQKDKHQTGRDERRNKTMTNIYAYRDVKIGYMEPFLQKNDEVAKRTFKISIQDPRTQLKQYKNDIELWRLGEYDEKTGVIRPETEFIIGGGEIKDE